MTVLNMADEQQAPVKRKSLSGCLGRSLIGLAVLCVLCFATAAVVVRTEQGRQRIRTWLGGRLGLELETGGMSLGLPFTLNVRDVSSVGFDMGHGAGLKADQLSITPGWRGVKIVVRKGDLRMHRDEDGAWAPALLAWVGEAPYGSIAAFSGRAAAMGPGTSVRVLDSRLGWTDAGGVELGTASGVTFECGGLELRGRKGRWFYLRLVSLIWHDGAAMHDVEREWLSLDGRDYIEIDSVGRTVVGETLKFWDVSADEETPELLDAMESL